MPPAKTRPAAHDASSLSKDKAQNGLLHATVSKKRNAHQPVNGSALKTLAKSAPQLLAVGNGASGAQEEKATMSWPDQDLEVLEGYRSLYKIDCPTSFKNPLGQVILSKGIGPYSPTMLRAKNKRRVSKPQLAMAVRKNFNALAVNETDVLVGLMYRAKTQEKAFRVRFAPPRK